VFPPDVIEQLGMKHVRGILLYGPPGEHSLAIGLVHNVLSRCDAVEGQSKLYDIEVRPITTRSV
jgi:SpoVK/Ycf46/Vps4 family AAA+-type ATPase